MQVFSRCGSFIKVIFFLSFQVSRSEAQGSLQSLQPVSLIVFIEQLHHKTNHCKVPKFLDARKLFCYLLKIQTMRQKLRVFRQKDANEIANSEDSDQTAPRGAV